MNEQELFATNYTNSHESVRGNWWNSWLYNHIKSLAKLLYWGQRAKRGSFINIFDKIQIGGD